MIAAIGPARHAIVAAVAAFNSPPTITIERLTGAEADEFSEVRLRVTVVDADGDLVSARLVDGPARMWMAPIVDQPSGTTREIRWWVTENQGGYRRIAIEAHDDFAPSLLVRAETTLHATGSGSPGARLVDFDGDGALELLARAPLDDVGMGPDTGAIQLFGSGVTAPISRTWPYLPRSPFAQRRLVASLPLAGEMVGAGFGLDADLNGDGIRDFVSNGITSSGQQRYVWFGRVPGGGAASSGAPSGPATDRAPDATLLLSSGTFVNNPPPLLLVGDVTGDGVDDLVVSDPSWSGSAPHAGRIVVFAGGPAIAGTHAPTASLELPSPATNDDFAVRVRLGDVTGDGIADVVATSPWATVGGRSQQGAGAVFAGGPALTGNVAPTAYLLGRAAANAQLGAVPLAYGLYLVDLDGDLQQDVVVGAAYSGTGGEIYFWKGGASLTGTPAANAVLVDTRANFSFELGFTTGGGGIQFADVTNDGYLDVVAADVGAKSFAGLVKVWAGGPSLSGTTSFTASLGDTIVQSSAFLSGFDQGFRVVDVTADGILDVVALAPQRTIGAKTGVGACYVWAGGAALSGSPAPSATLVVNGSVALDRMGNLDGTNPGAGMRAVDVTGDGLVDLVIGAPLADEAGIVDSGAIYVFKGGSTLTGTVNPVARLRGLAPVAGDRLAGGWKWTSTYTVDVGSFEVEDVTGDGIADVIAKAEKADVAGLADAGAIYVFEGGAGMTGVKTPRASIFGTQNWATMGEGPLGFALGDADGDGVLDVVGFETGYGRSYSGSSSIGRAHVVLGGTTLVGTPAPWRLLTTGGGGDLLFSGAAGSPDLLFTDLDRDGSVDLVAPSPEASFGGAILWWPADPRVTRPVELRPYAPDWNGRFGS